MDAVAVTPCDVEFLRQNRLLMVHCLDLNERFQVKMKSFPVLALKLIYGHISFLSELAERRVVVFPDGIDTHTKFQDVKSPCYIEVKSSAVFEVAADETEDGQEAQIAVIWDFEIVPGMTAAACAVKPVEKPADNFVIMPRLAFSEVSTCNCKTFPRVGAVTVSGREESTVAERLENLQLNVSDSSDCSSEEFEEEEIDDEKQVETNTTKDESLESFTEVMRLRGSSYHPRFQKHLKMCKELMINKEHTAIRFQFEPTNKRDENAIVVQAELNQGGSKEWKPIGYVPGQKVPKVTLALRNNDIQMVTLKNVFYQYVIPIQQFRYFPSIAVTKLGRWPRNKQDYKYNEKI